MRQIFSTSVRNQHPHPSLQYESKVYSEHTHRKWIPETGNLYTMFNFVGFARGLNIESWSLTLYQKVNIIVTAQGASTRLHGPVSYFHNVFTAVIYLFALLGGEVHIGLYTVVPPNTVYT